MGRRFAGTFGSIFLHGAVGLAVWLAFPERELPIDARGGVGVVRLRAESMARPMKAQALRERLVVEARKQRSLGSLELGTFLLAANAIDAEEEGTGFDLVSATSKYQSRVRDLRIALEKEPIDKAVPRLFGDLRYAGLPGGRMGDLLLSGSGSCEPLSQLVAAALHDAGVGDRARLRYYGGLSAGVSHLAPVVELHGIERDLTAGARSIPGGTAFAASDLVDAYARAHHLDGETAVPVIGARRRSGAGDDDGESKETSALLGETPKTRTMIAGYPGNDDRFEGALPLYSDRAVADPDEGPAGAKSKSHDAGSEAPDEGSDVARTCPFLLRVGELDPPRATALVDDGAMDLTLHHVPSREQLMRTAGLVASVERERARVATDPIREVVALGCLAGLYDRAALEFSFAREPDVVKRAVAEATKVRALGAALIGAQALGIDRGKDARKKLLDEASLGAWVLLYLDGGGEVVSRLATETRDDSFATVGFAAALVVDPSTRGRGLAFAAALPLDTQIAVMQELAHAQDNTRPWSATYDPGLRSDDQDPQVDAFVRTYEVLRPIAWRLWEAPVSPSDAIETIVRQAKEESLDEKTTRLLVAYYVQNQVWFYSRRDDGTRVMGELDNALRAHRFPGLLQFNEIRPLPADAASIGAALDAFKRSL